MRSALCAFRFSEMELASPSAKFLLSSSGQSEFDLQCLGGRRRRFRVLCASHGIVRVHNTCSLGVVSLKRSIGTRVYSGHSFTDHPDEKLPLHMEFTSRDASLASSSSSGFALRRRRQIHSLCSNGFVGAMDANAGEGGGSGTEELQGWEKKVEKFGEALSTAFPLWVGLACILALVWPNATAWINQSVQVWGITVTMLGMGMTLTLEDFQGAFAMPKELLAGVILQYTVMPSAGYAVSRLLQLPPHYAAGLILVACCPGGTASNIVTYLARGNVALSVLMTAASTFLAVVMTPLLTAKLVGQYISVDAFALFASTVQVVLLPVVGGAIMNYFFTRFVKKISLVAPTIAVFIVAVVCAGAVGRSSEAILASGGQVVLAVVALHSIGFAGGYILSHLLGIDESSSRTISIEVGMQNSVLGVVLAGQHFSNPLTAVPCAVSSVCHSLIGSTLAGLWRLNPSEPNNTPKDGMQVEVR